ncbi:MAG: insulinase family protein [Gammaproteobacteria bacterium]|nr:insulinase family protein [Gammaproteobacteria bacterium]
MYKSVLLAALVAVIASTSVHAGAKRQKNAAAGPQAAVNDIFDLPYLMRDLDNGLRVIVVKTDYPDIVSLQIPVQTGSRNEVEEGKSGFAHFFEHMMFRGTPNYSQEEYGRILKNAGADQNAYTSADLTNYHITFTRPDLEKVLELEADRFQNLSYTEEQFRTEALAVKGEYLKNFSSPIRQMLERIQDNAYTTHTYKHTTMGFLRDIEAMPDQMEYSKLFFERWYSPEKAAVIVVGDVEPEETFRLVKKYWGGWKGSNYQVEIPQEPAPQGPYYDHIEWEQPAQPWIMIGFRGPRFDPRSKDMPAMDLISNVYFSETSAIYQKLVTRDQLADQLWAYFPDRKDPGLLIVAARLLDEANVATVRDEILDTLAVARTELVDAAKLEAIKANQRYSLTNRMDNSASIASMLASYVHFERTPETLNQVFERYAELTPADLATYANKYFTDAGMVTVTLANAPRIAGIQDGPTLEQRVAALADQPAAEFELVELQSQSSPLVDVAFLFNVGAAYDPPGKKGLSVLTAQMIGDGGSKKRTIDELNEAMYPMASGFGVHVDKEMSRLGGTVHKDKLADWYSLASEQLLTPGWRDADFERIKNRVISAIKSDLVANNDEELGKEALYNVIYGPDHPYGALNLGAVEDLESITLDDVKSFYNQYYVPANLTVGLAGGYSDKFVQTLRADLGNLPQAAAAAAVELPQPVIPQGHTALVLQKETPGVAVSFGYPINIVRGDPDWVALWLVRSYLGEHRSSNSHLYQRIRATRGMNYGDYAYIEYFPRGMFLTQPEANLGRRQQIFQVWIRPLRNNNDAHFATRVAIHEIDKLTGDGMSADAFEATRNYLDKYVSLLVASQSRQLGYALDSDYYGTAAFTDYVRDGLAQLTLNDVNRVIREYLQTDDMHFVFVTGDADDLRNRLASNQPSPIEYNSPKPDLAEEDAMIAALPLNFSADAVQTMAAEEIFDGEADRLLAKK